MSKIKPFKKTELYQELRLSQIEVETLADILRRVELSLIHEFSIVRVKKYLHAELGFYLQRKFERAVRLQGRV